MRSRIAFIFALTALCTWLAAGLLAQTTPPPNELETAGVEPVADEDEHTETLDPFVRQVDPAEAVTAEIERGHMLLRLGRPGDAALAFRAVLAAHPEHLRALEGLRRAAIAAQHEQTLVDATARLADVYLAAGDHDTANRRLDELIELDPVHEARGRLEQALGRTEDDRDAGGLNLLARMRSLLGVALLLFVAWLWSSNRRAVRYRLVFWGLGLQLTFAVLILNTAPGRWIFDGARAVVDRILRFSDAGAEFLFGRLYHGTAPGPTSGPVQYIDGTSGDPVAFGTMFAFHVLPTIIFFGSLMAVLYHLRVIQKLVRGIAWLMTRTMGTSGSESLAVASNIFVGQTEAPLVVKPYVERMTQSELMAIMTGGFATVSGGVLAAYVRYGIDAGHLMAASVMSAPAALVVAKIMFPETEESETRGGHVQEPTPDTANVVDAAAAGATDGLKLAFNVAAMLVAFMALIAMVNFGLGQLGGLVGMPELSLNTIFGVIFYPLSWAMGADTQDLFNFGHLLGTKISLNEFVAFADLGHMKQTLTPRSFAIATYALCGFANFSSIGIQIGGISAVAEGRRSDLARIGLKAMFAGAFASWLTACVAGMFI